MGSGQNKLNWDLIGKYNTVGGAPRDVRRFCDDHEPLSFDALYLRACSDPDLLRRAVELIKTGGILAIRFTGGLPALTSRTVYDRMMSEVFQSRWWLYVCRDGDVIWTRISRHEGRSEVHWEDRPLAFYVDLLRQDIPFSFLRYNDGEWSCTVEAIYPGPGQQAFTEELSSDLQVSLIDYHKDPRYFMGMTPIRFHVENLRTWELIAAFLRKYDLDGIEWVSTRVFNHASEAGDLWPFIQHLQQHDIVIVGPPKLSALKKLFPRAAFVVIPATQCHAKLAAIEKDVLAQKLPAIILITAGPACEPLIHRLFEEIGDSSTMIDMGSLWGPYIGKAEHQVHFTMTPEIMARNTGGLL